MRSNHISKLSVRKKAILQNLEMVILAVWISNPKHPQNCLYDVHCTPLNNLDTGFRLAILNSLS